MEKLKNMINPGSRKDDEVMYGSGNSDDPVHSGQGSHFSNSRTAGNDPLSSSTNTASTSGPGYGTSSSDHQLSSSSMTSSAIGVGNGSTFQNDPMSTSSNPTGSSQYDSPSTSGQGSHGLKEPYASRMPGGFNDDDDAATTASVRSGVPGQSQSGPKVMSGVSSDVNKPLPSEPASTGTEMGAGSSLTGSNYPHRSVGSSGYGDQPTGSSHLGRDAALGAGAGAVGAGAVHHRHEEPQRENYAPETGRSFPLGGNSDNSSRSNYSPGQTGTYPAGGAVGSSTTGSHASNLANKVDPRVDSGPNTGRTAYDSSNVGAGTSTTMGAGDRTGYGSGTGPVSNPSNQGSLERDAALGAGAGATGSGMAPSGAGYGSDSLQHDHSQHGHQYEGDPCETTHSSADAHPMHTSGPHITDTANRLDPHVAGGASGGLEQTSHHRGEEAALAGGTRLGAYEGNRSAPVSSTGTGYDSTNQGVSEGFSTGKTSGPHKSDMLNKIDPRVDSDMSKQQSGMTSRGTGTADPYSSTTSTHSDHHFGRDAALGGAGGAAVYEAEKHRHGHATTGTASETGSTAPYDNSRISSGTSGIGSSDPYNNSQGISRGSSNPYDNSRTSGSSSGITSSDPYDSSRGTTGTQHGHHLGRDAALGAGAGGLAYEAERHHSKHTELSTAPTNTATTEYGDTSNPSSSNYDQAGTQLASSGHQSATAGTSYAPVTETEKPHKSHGLFGHHKDKDAAAAGGVGYEAEKLRNSGRVDPGTQVREHEHPGASLATYPSPGYGHERDAGTSHHMGRDAAIGGAAVGGAGYGAEQSHDSSRGPGLDSNSQTLNRATDPSRDNHLGRDAAMGGTGAGGTGYGAQKAHDPTRDFDPSSNYAHMQKQEPTQGHHTGRDAALVGGAAGAGALAGHEYSAKDAKHEAKEHAKEEKALEKEHSKEMKQHDKEVAKHEKAIEKDERKHEKAMEKEEKKHDHGSGEKKKGGILGLFHREKPDPELKEDERLRQHGLSDTSRHGGNYSDEMSSGSGATSRGLERPYGTESSALEEPVGFGNAAPSGLEGTSGGLEKNYAGTSSTSQGYEEQHGSGLGGQHSAQSGVQGSQMGSGMTTHDAYDNDPNKYNKLHKDPPSKILESRGL